MITDPLPLRTLSWSGTLPLPEPAFEHADSLAPPSQEATHSRQRIGAYRNDLPTLLRVLDGLRAL